MRIIIELFFLAIAFGIFFQTSKELWNEIGKDVCSSIINSLKTTKLGMWVNNKINRVEILTDEEYANIILNMKGELKTIEY